MIGLPTCLLFYDADGDVVGTLNYMVQYDGDGNPKGLVDFEAQELSGGRLRDITEYSNAVGAGTWPEWLGSRAMDFRVELRKGSKGGSHMIQALVHRRSGFRRERSAVDASMEELVRGKGPDDIVDARPVLGGPEFSLRLDDDGRTAAVFPAPVLGRAAPKLPLYNVKPEEPVLVDSLAILVDLDAKRQEIMEKRASGYTPDVESVDPKDADKLAKLGEKK